jgi:hypothetical protein
MHQTRRILYAAYHLLPANAMSCCTGSARGRMLPLTQGRPVPTILQRPLKLRDGKFTSLVNDWQQPYALASPIPSPRARHAWQYRSDINRYAPNSRVQVAIHLGNIAVPQLWDAGRAARLTRDGSYYHPLEEQAKKSIGLRAPTWPCRRTAFN